MHEEVIRARLLVRTLGLVMIALSMNAAVDGVIHALAPDHAYDPRMFDPPTYGEEPHVLFFWWPVALQAVARWCAVFLVPSIIFAAGAALALRGSRRLEGRLLRATKPA